MAAGAASSTVTTATHSMIPNNIFARSACACMVEEAVRCDSPSQTSQTSASPLRSTRTKPARQAYIVQRRACPQPLISKDGTEPEAECHRCTLGAPFVSKTKGVAGYFPG